MIEAKFRVKGILLDLDGTLVDSREAYLEAARRAFQALKQEFPGAEVALEIPRFLERQMQLGGLLKVDVKKFLDVYLSAYSLVTAEKTRLLPGVSEALKILAGKAKLGLITMRCVPKTSVLDELERFGISDYLSCVVVASDDCKPKPSPEALLKCAEAWDVELGDCVMVGDSVSDLRAGRAAGVKTVAVLSGLYSGEELALEKPDLILKNVTLLPEFIE
jgi:phosphoglycolate phosphatase